MIAFFSTSDRKLIQHQITSRTHMLRSRARSSTLVDFGESIFSPSRDAFSVSNTRRSRKGCRVPAHWWKVLVTSFLVLLLLYLYKTRPPPYVVERFPSPKVEKHILEQDKLPDPTDDEKSFVSEEPIVFVVERSIIRRLEKMQSLLDDEGSEDTLPTPPTRFNWPPIVTSLPEPKRTRPHPRLPSAHRVRDADHRLLSPHDSFLLPARMPDQETDASNHLLQLAQLAQRLNRTLILPQVGKGRLGACYRWEFETHYDLRSLQDMGVAFARTRDLSNWAKRYTHTTAQVVSIFPQDQGMADLGEEPLFRRFDEFYEARDLNLPSCLEGKFSFLDLNDFPHLRIYLSAQASEEKLVDALSGEHNLKNTASLHGHAQLPHYHALSVSSQSPPDVLLINWYPLFPVFPPALQVSLRYSEHLTTLAEQLAPSTPYLAIYWHTVGLSPDVLQHCADSLVDTVSRLLSDPSLSMGIKTVWFANDLPYSTSSITPRNETLPRRGLTNAHKTSASFSHLTNKYAEAVEILKEAFADGGALDQWRLTGLTNELRKVQPGTDDDLLQDSGVMEILDRLVGSRAALFVSGARACGHTSAFSQQILDIRQEELAAHGKETLKNMMDVFG